MDSWGLGESSNQGLRQGGVLLWEKDKPGQSAEAESEKLRLRVVKGG